ncbi:hypothetical protein AU378_22685 [Chryseobacterium kwangjuense]|uniref:Uncharacterized protein n=1 Tax=Chryseobacterium kwangjuense TaxID=267125 RepID=A0A135WFQ1_9FLAO|nr:hypothetical protein AU378_22685 [Chryseobacterium kwangjuense]
MNNLKNTNLFRLHFITSIIFLLILYGINVILMYNSGSDWELNKRAFNPLEQLETLLFAFVWSLGKFGYAVLLAILLLMYSCILWVLRKFL